MPWNFYVKDVTNTWGERGNVDREELDGNDKNDLKELSDMEASLVVGGVGGSLFQVGDLGLIPVVGPVLIPVVGPVVGIVEEIVGGN